MRSGSEIRSGGRPLGGLRLWLSPGAARGLWRLLLKRPSGLVETLGQEAAASGVIRASDLPIFTLRYLRLEVRAVLSPTSVPWADLQAAGQTDRRSLLLRCRPAALRGRGSRRRDPHARKVLARLKYAALLGDKWHPHPKKMGAVATGSRKFDSKKRAVPNNL